MSNFIIIIGITLTSYLITQFFAYIERCEVIYRYKKIKTKTLKDDLYRKKLDKLYNNIYNHFLTEAINTPEIIANNLANMHISRIEKNNDVDKLYTLMIKKQAI